MRYAIHPSSLSGKTAVPSSKSHTLRAILFGMMGRGKTRVFRYLPSPDTDAMIAACRLFGCKIDVFAEFIEIEGLDGKLGQAEDVIDAGNSGQVLRFIGALSSLSPGITILTGDASVKNNRVVQPLLDGLTQLGAEAFSMRGNGHAPIVVRGPIRGGEATISGEDSQPVSGLIIASAFAKGKTELVVKNPGEKPWVGLTLSWLDRLGIAYRNEGFEKYTLFGNSQYEGFNYIVPGDFSTAAFPIAAALITDSELTLENIDMNDVQGDKALIPLLQKMGARIEVDLQKRELHVKKGSELRGIQVDINDFIDSITILSVLGCFAKGKTEIVNAKIARKKECDRISSIVNELKKMGAEVVEKEDGLVVTQSDLHGSELKSYNDHRMAMSLMVASFAARGNSVIDNTDCIAKSHPSFIEDFQKLGAKITRE